MSTILGATLMAVAAMTSLIIGAAIGTFAKPSHRLNAIIMAFGTGALIQALSLELAYEGAERLMHESHMTGFQAWLWVSCGFAVGGSVYYFANRILEARGASMRHPALAKLYVLDKKREELAGILSRLSHIELVRSLPPEDMQDVLMCVQPVTMQAGSTVFRRGEAANALFLIDEGTISIYPDEPANGNEPLARLGPGQSFGEMALLTGEPRSASAHVDSDATLLRVDKVHFDELIDRSPRLRHAVEQLTSQRLLQNVESAHSKIDAEHWQKVAVANIHRLGHQEEMMMMKKHAEAGAPLAIFLGAMLDGIPESIVIGSNFTTMESFRYTFLAAVFLSNLPEAMASAVGMKNAGFSKTRVFGLWGFLVAAGAAAAALGNIFLASAPAAVLTLVGAVAGGGILAMVSSVMMPEAYEDGGAAVGLATIAGFIGAFFFTLV